MLIKGHRQLSYLKRNEDLNYMQGKKELTPQQMTPRGEKEKLNDKVKVVLRVRPFVEV